MPIHSALPGWPAALHEDWAAAYVGLPPSTFRAHVAKDVPPVQLTKRRVGWLRSDLDTWLAKRAAGTEAASPANPWDED